MTAKFEYVVSGVELNEQQKAEISAAIATAVSSVIIGTPPRVSSFADLVKGKVWATIDHGHGPINGGIMILAAERARLKEMIESTPAAAR